MATNDAEVVRGIYDAWNRGGIAQAFELVDPEIEWLPLDHSPFAGRLRGRDEVRRHFESLVQIWDEWRLLPVEIEDRGDGTVVVDLRSTGRGRDSGAPFEFRMTHVWRLRDGRPVLGAVFTRRDDALALLERER